MHFVVAEAMRVLRIVAEMPELAAGAVQQIEAVERAYPQPPLAVFQHGPHHVVGQAVRVGRIVAVSGKGPADGVETVHAAARRDPQHAAAVAHDIADGVAVRIAGGKAHGKETPEYRIEAVQARRAAHPQGAVRRLVQGGDLLVARHAGRAAQVEQARAAVARIVQFQAALGGQPQFAIARVGHGAHFLVRQRAHIAGRPRHARKAAAAQVDPAHAVVPGADPERARAVAVQRRQLVVGDAEFVARLVPVLQEGVALGLPAEQAIGIAAQPDGGVDILVQAGHADGGKTLFFMQAQARLRCLAGASQAPALGAGHGADPQILLAVHQQRLDHVIFGTGRRVDGEMLEAVAARRQHIQARDGADPQALLRVQRQRLDFIVAQAVRIALFMVPGAEGARGGVEMLQTVRGGDPEAARAIVKNGVDMPVAVAALALFGRDVMDEGLAGGVEAVQAVVGAHPQLPLAIDMQFADPIVGQAGLVALDILVDDHTIAVVAAQARLAAEPHIALPVLGDGQHRFLRQALFHAELIETQGGRRRRRGRAARQQQRQQQYHFANTSKYQHNRPVKKNAKKTHAAPRAVSGTKERQDIILAGLRIALSKTDQLVSIRRFEQ